MKLWVVAVGQRVPDWAQTAWDDYAKRFPPELRVELKAVKTEPRGSRSLDTLLAAERIALKEFERPLLEAGVPAPTALKASVRARYESHPSPATDPRASPETPDRALD